MASSSCTRKQQVLIAEEMLSVKSTSPNSSNAVYPHQMLCSPSSSSSQTTPKPTTQNRVFSKRIRKCHAAAAAKRTGEQSIAPLLETISALAVNSDPSDDDEEEYQEYQGSGGMHEEDEDGVEDYDFEQNLSEEQKFGGETADKSFGGDQRDNTESCSEDLQFSGPNQASSAFPRHPLQQHSDLKPVNAYVVSEPFCSPISRVSSSVVNRPRFELSSNENNANQWSPQNETTSVQHCSAISNNNSNNASGKCVRFNADVQVTSVSPRLAHKVPSITTGNSINQYGHQLLNRYHCTEYNRPAEMAAISNGFSDQQNHGSDVGSNTYDEVASTTGSQTVNNVKMQTNEHQQPMNSNLLGNRVVRDLSAAELQRKFKKAHLNYEQESSSQPLYCNIDQALNESKEDHKMANPSSSVTFHQKSILKDPLCAKLRSAIRKGQFATNDLTQLESEIDSLFCGNDLAKTDENGVNAASRANAMDNEEKSTCNMLAPDLLDGLDSKEKLKNEKLFKNKSPLNAFKTSPQKLNADRNHNASNMNAAPCNSYIKMIEEKYRNKETTIHATQNKQKLRKNFVKVKNNFKQNDPEQKAKQKPVKTTNHLKLKNLNFESINLSKSSTSFHKLHQPHSNMPMFSSSMDQLMNNIIHETSQSENKAENDKVKQHENHCKLPVLLNKKAPKIPNRIVPVPFSKDTNRRNNLYSYFADPVKGPSINNLMDELSRNNNSFSDNESIKSSTSTLSKSLVENHIYEEILYECFEKQNQLDSVITGVNYQLDPVINLSTNPKTVSNELNVTSFMSNLTTTNSNTIDTTFGFAHKI